MLIFETGKKTYWAPREKATITDVPPLTPTVSLILFADSSLVPVLVLTWKVVTNNQTGRFIRNEIAEDATRTKICSRNHHGRYCRKIPIIMMV
mmetsp:Transcript_4908/g.11688  ORF Transcript_4908/g.11688 Transcript_4908/m.11688 type:complete len:93 (-) Transcript_4908:2503-2781(-)